MWLLFGALVVFLPLTGGVLVSVPPPTAPVQMAKYPDCSKLMTQAELTACAWEAYKEDDRILNRVYQAALIDFSGPKRQQYVQAQVKWISFRDAECRFFSSALEGGSAQPMIEAGCLATVTQERSRDLQAYGGGTLPKGGQGSYEQSDRQLNQLYQKLRQTVSAERRSKLETAELAWIPFRDAVCTFEGTIGGKSAQTRCLTRLTNQRNQQLQEHLKFLAET